MGRSTSLHDASATCLVCSLGAVVMLQVARIGRAVAAPARSRQIVTNAVSRGQCRARKLNVSSGPSSRRDVVNVFAPRMRTFADKPKHFKPDQAISRTKSRILPDQAISRTMSRNLGKSAKSIKAQSTWMQLATKIQAKAQGFVSSIPSYLSRARVFTIECAGDVRNDPKILAVWTVAGWKFVKGFLHHLWVGTKLLAKNTQIATRLVRRVGEGKQLSRSQQRLLMRTSTDLLRLIPFSFFILIPFMEIFLPVALKVFPNMIPSTFQDAKDRERKRAKTLKGRVQSAQQLRDVLLERVHLISLQGEDQHKSDEAVEFAVFLEKMRRGIQLDKKEVTRAAHFFTDEFTIDGLGRSQLSAMAEAMGIGVSQYASDGMVRFQIRRNLRIIQADDRKLYWEGVSSLVHDDLVEANDMRGLPHHGITDDQMAKQLNRWLLLSMNSAVPPALLILSRSFVITEDESRFLDGSAIAAAIKAIPKSVKEEIQEELMEEELEKREMNKPIKSDEEVLEELKAADALAQEESKRLDEMVEEDRCRSEKVVAFQSELVDMSATVLAFETRLKEMDSVIKEALEQSKREMAAEDDEVALETRVKEKKRLEKAAEEVEQKQAEFKEQLASLQGDVKATHKKSVLRVGTSMNLP